MEFGLSLAIKNKKKRAEKREKKTRNENEKQNEKQKVKNKKWKTNSKKQAGAELCQAQESLGLLGLDKICAFVGFDLPI